jgi:hypothetical protein
MRIKNSERIDAHIRLILGTDLPHFLKTTTKLATQNNSGI